MSVNEEDEAFGDLDRMVRAGVMAGAQVAERVGRTRAERDRAAADTARTEAANYERRFTADRDVARAFHRQVADPAFWEKATPERVAQTFAAAYQWREHDGQAAVALGRLADGLREHHGLEVDKVLPGVLAGELDRIGPLREEHAAVADLRADPEQREYAEKVMGPLIPGRADLLAQYEQELASGRAAAREVHQQVHHPDYWKPEVSSPDRLAQTFAAAYQWREHDPAAAESLAAFTKGMQEHRGVDVDAVLAGELDRIGPVGEAHASLGELRTDPERRELAQQVLGKFIEQVDPFATASQKDAAAAHRDDVDEVVDTTAADADRAAAERAQADRAAAERAAAFEVPVPRAAAEAAGADVSAGSAPTPGERATSAFTAAQFPTSAADAQRGSHRGARARVVRSAGRDSGREQDLGR